MRRHLAACPAAASLVFTCAFFAADPATARASKAFGWINRSARLHKSPANGPRTTAAKKRCRHAANPHEQRRKNGNETE